jgi:hypothetical protein
MVSLATLVTSILPSYENCNYTYGSSVEKFETSFEITGEREMLAAWNPHGVSEFSHGKEDEVRITLRQKGNYRELNPIRTTICQVQ